MIEVGVCVLLLGREIAARRVLALALFAVLVADPWAVLAPGFWLSFGAVALILFVVSGPRPRVSGWRAAARVQVTITLGLAPLLLVAFGIYPLVSPLANALAIPLVSFVITPLVLIAMCVPVETPLALATCHHRLDDVDDGSSRGSATRHRAACRSPGRAAGHCHGGAVRSL